MARLKPRRTRKRVGRRYVPESEYPIGSPRIPEPSDWILLTRQYGDHSFTMKDPRVPDKPGCYEIGISTPGQKPTEWVVYAGKTGGGRHTLRGRLYNHASGHGSNLKQQIDRFLSRGYWIWARHYATESIDDAATLEKLLFKERWWHYLWNSNEVPPDLLA